MVAGSIVVTFDVAPAADGSISPDDALTTLIAQTMGAWTPTSPPTFGGPAFTVVTNSAGLALEVVAGAGAASVDCAGAWGNWGDDTCPAHGECTDSLGACSTETRAYGVTVAVENGGVACPSPLTEERPGSLVCTTCIDGTQNGDETGDDCGGACPACVAATSAGATTGPAPAPPPAAAAEEESSSIWWIILLVLCCCGGAGGGGFFVIKKKMDSDADAKDARNANAEFEITDNPTADDGDEM